MEYVLKNKDIAVLSFEVGKKIESYEHISKEILYIKNFKIINNALLPLSMELPSLSNLERWIKKRKVPSNRAFVDNILNTLNVDSANNFMAYIDISLGLSLNDSYWIIPSNKDYKWRDYNLYDNKFDEALALVAFNAESYKVSGITISPEYTTNGMLKNAGIEKMG